MNPTDREAFDEFVRARSGALLRLAHVLTGNPDAAADLVQEAFARTALAWPRVLRKDDPEGYVRRVMINLHTNMWRLRRNEDLTADPTDRPAPPDHPHDHELWTALATLPRRQRAVLVLRYYEDLTEAQTAAVLGCSVGTVKSQTHKALAKLRQPNVAATLGLGGTQP